MKHIILITAFLLILISIAVCAAIEDETPILYYETDATINDVFDLQQDYSIKVMDINSNNGDLWIQVSLEGDEVDNGFVRENDPYEYILELEDNEDECTKKYLIVKVSFIDKKNSGDETISKILIEQFLDPERSDSDFLILGSEVSVEEGEEKILKNGYTLTFTDIDTDTATLILKKDGNILKTEDEIEEGDVFSYTLEDNGEVHTIFMAYVDTIFEGTDSKIVILRNVTLRKDSGIDAGLNIEISLSDVSAGEEAIISYTLDEAASRVEVFLDGELIDHRNNVDAGTYPAITGKLDAGIYEISVKAITEEGLEVEKDVAFEVKSKKQTVSVDDIEPVVGNITDVINESGIKEELKGIPGFGAVISVLALVSAIMWKRR
ncbi:S-layer protein domain-containing protein [Methanohalophilus sp.]|uniref:S-layer protein domain-containing protein n=1 Tax=Methanohalophilus sp. TaxID=1966352 RepID=UPI00261DBD00|nr:S-layer protein domain-containing protein [Methanohalophilus sp.]MDK2891934.1 hypothetical protein [Methanohalophilus sp.]